MTEARWMPRRDGIPAFIVGRPHYRFKPTTDTAGESLLKFEGTRGRQFHDRTIDPSILAFNAGITEN